MTPTPVFVGLDVAKATLDVALRPSGEHWSVPNDEAGAGALVERLRPLHPTLVVCEATGGFERAAIAMLAAAGLPVVVANPRQVRDFARATGQLAKTDRLDADTLALFAERVRPTPRPLPDEAAQLLDALLTRRRQLLEMLVAEKNRLGFAPRPLHHGIHQHIRWLERQLDNVTKDLADQIERSPVWRAKDDLLQSVPGVGPIVSAVLLAELPELGALSHKQARHPGGRGAAGPRQRHAPRQAPGVGRPGRGAHRTLSGGALWPAVESAAAGLLRAAGRCRKAQEGGAYRLRAETPDDSQRDAPRQYPLGRTGDCLATQLLTDRA